jgi:hypothetical protein
MIMKFESTLFSTQPQRFFTRSSSGLLSIIITGIVAMTLPFAYQQPAVSVKLYFSPEQKQQLMQLRQETKQRLSQILTPTQFSQFSVSVREGRDLQQIVSDLDLPPAQATKVLGMIQEQPRKVLEILTPEQKDQLRQEMAQVGNHKMLNI